MASTLELTLLLLVAAVVGVVVCRLARLPPMLGYLVVGIVIGPSALGPQRPCGGRVVPGRVRHRLPDVRDRPRVQPAEAAQHEEARVRARPVAGGADDPRRGRRQRRAGSGPRRRRPVVGPRLAERHRPRRRAGHELDGDRRQADGRPARARERARPPRHGRAAVPGSRRGAAAGAHPGARLVARSAARRARDRLAQGGAAARGAARRRAARDALVADARRPAQERRAVRTQTCCW